MHTFQHKNDKAPDKAVTMYESTLQLISLKNLYHLYVEMDAYLNLIYNV